MDNDHDIGNYSRKDIVLLDTPLKGTNLLYELLPTKGSIIEEKIEHRR